VLDWKKIREEFEATVITLKELADKYNISAGTVRSRKNREKWIKYSAATGNAATRQKKKATQCNGAKGPDIKIEDVSEKLTEKERLFCWRYIHNFNATQAYLWAFGCAYNTAMVEGCKLLRKPNVKAEIARLKKMKFEAIQLNSDDIVLRNMQIAFADITDVAEWSVEETPLDIDATACARIIKGERLKAHRYNTGVIIKASNQIDGGLIKEISQTEHGIKVKMEDRRKALDWLADYMLMNPMNKYKIEYDKAVLALRERELKLKEF
jgi:phage terminase small subunit